MHSDTPVIEIDHNNWIGSTTFTRNGISYDINDISALRSRSVTNSYNFLPSYIADFIVTLSDNRNIRYHGFGALVKTRKIRAIHEAYDALCKFTFTRRTEIYLNMLRENGCFDYHNVSIHDNGDIKYKSTTVNIAEAALSGSVEIGYKVGGFMASSYNPYIVCISQKLPGIFFKQTVSFELKENADVLNSILTILSESRGGKIRIINS